MNWDNFKKDSEFDAIVAYMEFVGYSLISQVVITNKDFPYHVDFYYQVRHTKLFFGRTDKALIVSFECVEYTDKVDVKFAVTERVEVDIQANFTMDGWRALAAAESPNKIAEDLSLKGFTHTHLSQASSIGTGVCRQLTWHPETHKPLTVNLCEQVVRALEPYYSHIAETPFGSLQVTCWPPHYAFPKSEQLFWTRFDTKALKKFVKNPWGSL